MPTGIGDGLARGIRRASPTMPPLQGATPHSTAPGRALLESVHARGARAVPRKSTAENGRIRRRGIAVTRTGNGNKSAVAIGGGLGCGFAAQPRRPRQGHPLHSYCESRQAFVGAGSMHLQGRTVCFLIH